MRKFYTIVASAALALTSTVLAQDPVTYTKKVVVEEGTSTGCGYCPRGIVSLEMWHKIYGNRVIPIAVHSNMQNTVDPMVITSGAYFSRLGISGLPGGRFNRVPGTKASFMSPDEIKPYLEQTATAQATLEFVKYDKETQEFEVSYKARMGYANTTPLNMAVVLVEDNVVGNNSSYKQANYYSRTPQSDLVTQYGEDWWPAWQRFAESPQNISYKNMVHQHVARGIFPSFDGVNVSSAWLRDEDVAGKISFSMPKSVMVEENTQVIIVLTNALTGEIVGADYAPYADFNSTLTLFGDANNDGFVAINDIVTDAMYILEKEPARFDFEKADVNQDKVVNDEDVKETESIILSSLKELDPTVEAAKEECCLTAADVELSADNKSMTISAGDMTGVTAIQGDIVLPESIKVSKIALAEEQGEGHTMAFAELPDGRVRFVIYSLSLAELISDKPLLNVEFEHDNSFVQEEVALNNLRVSDAEAAMKKLADVNVAISNPSSIESISAEELTEGADIYNFQGIRVKSNASKADMEALAPGLYIIGGKKVAVTK